MCILLKALFWTTALLTLKVTLACVSTTGTIPITITTTTPLMTTTTERKMAEDTSTTTTTTTSGPPVTTPLCCDGRPENTSQGLITPPFTSDTCETVPHTLTCAYSGATIPVHNVGMYINDFNVLSVLTAANSTGSWQFVCDTRLGRFRFTSAQLSSNTFNFIGCAYVDDMNNVIRKPAKK
ncbi:unnamed protein product [Caenorhabditis auriculariae]|uniref:C6 domain-containing protein n=1 Tax=Caenorhabditis auriculariae TaxID=2777116 RepID=A0A8S1HJW1_9PELO|nr:unnamed protein product [Caenorhabditis auriculariae]